MTFAYSIVMDGYELLHLCSALGRISHSMPISVHYTDRNFSHVESPDRPCGCEGIYCKNSPSQAAVGISTAASWTGYPFKELFAVVMHKEAGDKMIYCLQEFFFVLDSQMLCGH